MKFLAVCRVCDGWAWCGRPCINQPSRVERGLFNVPFPLPPKELPKAADKPIRRPSVTEGVTDVTTLGVTETRSANAARQARWREKRRQKRAEEKHV
jgi:hypothetical protein